MDTNKEVSKELSQTVIKLIIVFKHPNYTEKNISILKKYNLHLMEPLNIKLLEWQEWIRVETNTNLEESKKICTLLMKEEKDYISDAYNEDICR
jgi:hypothetical protein